MIYIDILQDYYDEFLGASKSKGTLSFIRNYLNFRNVTKDVSECFNEAWELMFQGKFKVLLL